MTNPKLTLYVDVVSPFGYLAYYVLRHSPIFQSCEITYIPIFLGGLMKACNNRPPIEIKNKDKWINTERLRWANLFNIPMISALPAGFPPSTLHVQRVLTALQPSTCTSTSTSHPSPNHGHLTRALDALYRCFWVDGNADVGKVETFGPVLEEALGREVARRAIRESGGGGEGAEEVKKRLTENTDRAFESGAFGLPWFECVNEKGEQEGFWGFDHLGLVVRFLGLKGELRFLEGAGGRPAGTGLVEGMKAML